MIRSKPGLYEWYPSIGKERWDNESFEGCGPYYTWFCDLGYPNLDIKQWLDGEWAIVEYYNKPIIPALTKWNYVLYGLRNIEITEGFVTKYVAQLDLHKKEVWEEAEKKTAAMEKEKDGLEAHAQDTAERAKNIIMGNPALVERIARNGMGEINPEAIFKHIPNHYKRV